MFTLGRYPAKYIYPSLLFLLLILLLLIRNAVAEDRRPGDGNGRVETVEDRNRRAQRHSENEFLDALDDFNYRAVQQDNFEAALLRNEELAREAEREMNGPVRGLRSTSYERGVSRHMSRYDRNGTGFFGDRYGDSRYNEERRRLDSTRRDEFDEYQRTRRDMERRMSGYSRNDPEYSALEQRLSNLDRRYAERERDFENRFKNLDAHYSITRW